MTLPRRRPSRNLQHPCFARTYSVASRMLDVRGGAGHRRDLLAPLTGRVVEVGAGNGLNFVHYPSTVTGVIAVEPERRLRTEAQHAAARAQVPVTIVSARAEQLPAPDDHFDGAVVSLVLCSFPEPGEALAELRRVVRPGGIVRFYEHVRSTRRAVGLMQDAITPVWSRLAGGCHLNRDAVAAVARAGLEVMEVDRFPFAGVSHVAGTAVVPDAGTPPSS